MTKPTQTITIKTMRTIPPADKLGDKPGDTLGDKLGDELGNKSG